MNQEPTGIEAQVCADIANRQAFGIAKYGVTVQDNPLELRQWLQHAYEECLDQSVYLRRAMHEMDTAPPPNEQWRKTYGEVIKALAAIVNVRVPDKLFELDAVPREPVMVQVMKITGALKAFRLPAQPTPGQESVAWPIKGVRVDGDKVIVMAKGGNDAARWMCGKLLSMLTGTPNAAQPAPDNNESLESKLAAPVQEPAGWRPATYHRENLTFNPGLPDEQTVKFWKLQGVEIEYCYSTPPSAQPANQCTRSHPHENMDAMCELRTEIARLTNENARLKAQPAPVQEPVAWMQDSIELYVQDRPSAHYTIPLYTTPPAAQRQPLTDGQIEKLREKTFSTSNPFCPVDSKSMRKAVRAAEAAHGITKGGAA